MFLSVSHVSFSQKVEKRWVDDKGNQKIKWTDGSFSTIERDPTDKTRVKPDPQIRQTHFDTDGNRIDTYFDGSVEITTPEQREVKERELREHQEHERQERVQQEKERAEAMKNDPASQRDPHESRRMRE